MDALPPIPALDEAAAAERARQAWGAAPTLTASWADDGDVPYPDDETMMAIEHDKWASGSSATSTVTAASTDNDDITATRGASALAAGATLAAYSALPVMADGAAADFTDSLILTDAAAADFMHKVIPRKSPTLYCSARGRNPRIETLTSEQDPHLSPPPPPLAHPSGHRASNRTSAQEHRPTRA